MDVDLAFMRLPHLVGSPLNSLKPGGVPGWCLIQTPPFEKNQHFRSIPLARFSVDVYFLFHSLFWTTLLGLFAHLFINRDVDGDGVQRMKNAVLVDLAALILWFVSMLFGAVTYLRTRGREGIS